MSMETGANAGLKCSLKTGSLWYSQSAGPGNSSGRSGRTGDSDFLNTFNRVLKESGKTADLGQKQKNAVQADRPAKNDRKQEKMSADKSQDKSRDKIRETRSSHDTEIQRIPDDAAAAAVEAMETAAPTEGGGYEETAVTGMAGNDGESGTAVIKNGKLEVLFQGGSPLAELMAAAASAAKTNGSNGNGVSLEENQRAVSEIQSDGEIAAESVSGQMIQAGIRAGLSGEKSGPLADGKTAIQKQEAGGTVPAEFRTGLEGAEVLKSRNAENAAGQSGGQMKGSGGDGQTFSDMLKNQMEGARAMESGKTGAAEDNQEAGPAGDNQLLEELKRSADGRTGGFMDRLAEAGMNRGITTVQAATADSVGQVEKPVVEQLKAGLELGMKRELQEFTIKLKPEGLGDIIVHMSAVGGKTAVRIGASNPETEKLINSQMVNLKEMLEPLHAEVEEVYHNSQSAMEFAQFGQDMYQQQGRYKTSHSRHFNGSNIPEEEDDFLIDAERMIAESRAGRLYAYV